MVPFHWKCGKRAINRYCSTQIIARHITVTNKISYGRLQKNQNQMTRNENVLAETITYKTLRLDRVVSSLGIDPVSLLLFSRLHYQFRDIKNKSHTNLWLLSSKCKVTYRNLSDFNLAKDFGISPSNLLSYKSMPMRFFKLPNSFGIFPLISFL